MNISRIKQKLGEIEESLELILEYMPDNSKDFNKLGIVKDGIYKRLEFSIQNILDIFSMVYTDLKLGVPSSLDDILKELQTKGIFSKEIINLVRNMKGLRNILAHQYGKIDDKVVFELLHEKICDFEMVIKAIDVYLLK